MRMLNVKMWILIFVTNICGSVVAKDVIGGRSQFFLEEPKDVTVKAGQRYVFPCQVGYKSGTCKWTKNGLGLGEESELPGHPRYSMVDCSLHIEPVLLEDEGSYQCQVGPGDQGSSSLLQSRNATLTVQSEPGVPHIKQARLGAVLRVQQIPEKKQETKVLECISLGARPAATINWWTEGGQISVASSSEVTRMEDTGTFKTTSRIEVPLEENINIGCSASNELVPEGKFSNILQIVIERVEEVEMELSTSNIKEGDSLQVVCKRITTPNSDLAGKMEYTWYIGSQEVRNTGIDPAVFKISNINKTMDKTNIGCDITNSVGKSKTATKLLDVQYGPQITEQPSPRVKYAKEGETVQFSCQADSNPSPVIVWVNNETGEMIFGQQLNLIVSAKTAGSEWICRAHLDGFKPIDSNSVQIHMVQAPSIVSLEQGTVGEGEVMLHCVANSVAPYTDIVWSKNGESIEMSDSTFKIVRHRDNHLHHSYLIFSPLESESQYSCMVSNEVGAADHGLPFISSEDVNYLMVAVLPCMVTAALLSTLLSCYCCITHQKRAASTIAMEVEKRRNRQQMEIEPCLQQSLETATNRTFLCDEQTLSTSPSCASFNTTTSTLPSMSLNISSISQ